MLLLLLLLLISAYIIFSFFLFSFFYRGHFVCFKMIKWSCILRKCLVTAFTQVKVSRKQTSCSVCWLNKQCADCDPFWGENGAVVSLRGCWSLARSCWLVCNRRQWRFITSTAQWTFITPWCYSNSVPSEAHPHSLSPFVVVTPVLLREPEESLHRNVIVRAIP